MGKKKPNSEKKNRKTGLVVGGVLAAVLIGGYCLLCAFAGGGNVYPKVTVGDVALGGLTVEEAEAAISQSVKTQTPDESMGVHFAITDTEGHTAQVKVPMSAVTTDCPATAARAWNVGNGASFPARGAIYLKCLLMGQEILPAYEDTAALEAILDDMDAQIGQAAVESTWELGEKVITFTKGQPGNLIQRDELKTEIFTRLGQGEMVTLAGSEPQFAIQLKEALPQELDMKAILKEVETEVQNAEFNKAEKKFQTDSQGISFDAEAAETLFESMAWGETQDLDLIITEPEVTLTDLESQLYQDTLGTCSTNISGTENRVKNIALAAQIFNGTVLLPGEEFSYNGVVGSRQASRGFLPAPAYVSGQTVQEIGGGVCQGSSTIYLAALRANLEIVERYPHGYITRYVPDGMDATVYYGVKDFRFRNDTPFPIKVVGSVSGRTLTVNILGTKHNNITVEMTNQTVGSTGYNTVYKVDNSLSAGSTYVDVTPYAGYTIKVYRNLYENGKLLETRLEDTSVYRSRDQVIMVSPADAYKYGIPGYSKPAPKPEPAPEPAPAPTPTPPVEETTPPAETPAPAA
ncbi:MAG: VanW family protein [Ruminiclostridium sp.]|nr:VanW family protein [Ruminiclostridium sp.]